MTSRHFTAAEGFTAVVALGAALVYGASWLTDPALASALRVIAMVLALCAGGLVGCVVVAHLIDSHDLEQQQQRERVDRIMAGLREPTWRVPKVDGGVKSGAGEPSSRSAQSARDGHAPPSSTLDRDGRVVRLGARARRRMDEARRLSKLEAQP